MSCPIEFRDAKRLSWYDLVLTPQEHRFIGSTPVVREGADQSIPMGLQNGSDDLERRVDYSSSFTGKNSSMIVNAARERYCFMESMGVDYFDLPDELKDVTFGCYFSLMSDSNDRFLCLTQRQIVDVGLNVMEKDKPGTCSTYFSVKHDHEMKGMVDMLNKNFLKYGIEILESSGFTKADFEDDSPTYFKPAVAVSEKYRI